MGKNLRLNIPLDMDDHEVETSHSWAVVNSPGSNYFEGYDFSEYTEQAPDMKRGIEENTCRV